MVKRGLVFHNLTLIIVRIYVLVYEKSAERHCVGLSPWY